MLLSKRNNNDQTTFLSSIDPNNKRAILEFRREFQEKTESRLYTDYDRGFFSAWTDYMSVLKKMNVQEMKALPSTQSPPQPSTVMAEANSQAQASLVDWQEKIS